MCTVLGSDALGDIVDGVGKEECKEEGVGTGDGDSDGGGGGSEPTKPVVSQTNKYTIFQQMGNESLQRLAYYLETFSIFLSSFYLTHSI
ncbi:hypothetical protein M0804_009253 [Polistes exclamans]|nr:hypothetical protein M0804_009253 [Polistes exclamans]